LKLKERGLLRGAKEDSILEFNSLTPTLSQTALYERLGEGDRELSYSSPRC
jgi:hypothetical protein